MNKETAYCKISCSSNKAQIRYLGRYLDKVTNKLFSKKTNTNIIHSNFQKLQKFAVIMYSNSHCYLRNVH